MMRKALRYILILVLVQLSVGTMAQFKKPLSKARKQSDEAMFNLGIIAGPSVTHWHHFNINEADQWFLKNYTPKLKLGYTGGLYFEAILNKHWSVGVNVYYTKHAISMQYINKQFPYGWDHGILYSERTYDLSADYQTVAATVPLTYYFFNVKDPIRPYLYVAPRVSYIIAGDFHQTITDSHLQNPVTNDTALLAPDNHIGLNIGATLGVGLQFRISMEYYYFLVKAEALANWDFLNTFTEEQLKNEFYNKRQDANAAATITFIFPLKKSMKDACYIMR